MVLSIGAMDIDDESETTTHVEDETAPESVVPPESDEPTGLRRSTNRRMIGGVASGIAERFDIDANVVRAIFVLLACLWGFGAAVYLILWVLVPRSGEEKTERTLDAVSVEKERKMSLWRILFLVVGAACVLLIFIAFYTNGPRWGSGVGTAWLIFLVVLAVLSFRGPSRRLTLGRFFSGLFLVLISLLILVSGGFLGFLAMTKVPITGGIGDNVYAPTSIGQVKSTYRLAFGDMTVDLRHVPFKNHTLSVTASVAAGTLTVEVPPGVVVDVTAHSGVQNINYLIVHTSPGNGQEIIYDQDFGSFNASTGSAEGHLQLNASVGVGQIQLVRSTPDAAGFGD
jgi:phage shock protein C